MPNDTQLRKDICDAGRRIHARDLVAGTDGNISARCDDDKLIITPSGSCLGNLEPTDLVLINSKGETLSGDGRPSTEWWMHVTAYQQRSDINGIVHAHPPMIVAMTVAGVPFAQHALPELILAFGRIPTAIYATPTTRDGADAIRDLIEHSNAIVLDRHGSLTVAHNVAEAMYRLEKLEHSAHIMFLAHQLGGANDLPRSEIEKLAGLHEKYGYGKAVDILGPSQEG